MVAVDFNFIEENFYCIRFSDHPGKLYSVTLLQLQEKERLREFIDLYKPKIKALTDDVAATYFCSAYGWFLSGLQYILANYDTTYNSSLSNVELQMYYNKVKNSYGICFRLLDLEETPLPKTKGTWRNLVTEKLYYENVIPTINLLTDATAVNVTSLYGQLSIGLFYGHDMVIQKSKTIIEKQKLEADFKYVTKELEPSLFGLKKNPLDIQFRMIESPREEGVMIRMKPSCCLYYQTVGVTTKCYSCPRMSEKERAERKKEIVARMV
ncbi:(2Fe-2S)-binding protein [Alkalihalobacterium alkalinitrilicum]|uniref:(2Fe-2S)-binding protein n=1 Tax=Alkalihalobacterium alkalinitrilicum TaxID=427920 RepID=UPI000994DC36|nr:(2Fe-2S)-binding protein [Alkalihalobacterium alkalinitrilicum]